MAYGSGYSGGYEDVTAPSSVAAGTSLQAVLNILNGTVGVDAQGAANVWAGTTGLDLVGALNVKNGTTGVGLEGVLTALGFNVKGL